MKTVIQYAARLALVHLRTVVLALAVILPAVGPANSLEWQDTYASEPALMVISQEPLPWHILTQSPAAPDSDLFQNWTQDVQEAACCKRCSKGKPCGNSCIARTKTCRVGPGCAC